MKNINIYNINPEALEIYKRNAKHGIGINEEVIRRKLTALVINSHKKQLSDDIIRCTFGSFNMYINASTNTIEHLYWNTEDHKQRGLDQVERITLINTFKELGLTNKGNSFNNAQKTMV